MRDPGKFRKFKLCFANKLSRAREEEREREKGEKSQARVAENIRRFSYPLDNQSSTIYGDGFIRPKILGA